MKLCHEVIISFNSQYLNAFISFFFFLIKSTAEARSFINVRPCTSKLLTVSPALEQSIRCL